MYSCTLNNSITSNDLSLSVPGFTMSIYNNVSEIVIDWNSIAGENLFMHSSFLTALEETPPSGTSYKYVLVKKQDNIVGIVYFQVKKINLFQSLRLDAKNPIGWWNNFTHKIKCIIAKLLKANLLVLGNMTLTGSNGFTFDESIDNESAFKFAKESAQEVICQLKKEKSKIAAILIKDYYEDEKFSNEYLGYNVLSFSILFRGVESFAISAL